MNGLVNSFALHRFTGAAPDDLYKKLMEPVLNNCDCGFETKEQLKFQVSPADLPREWTANVKRENDNPRTDWWNT